MTLRGLLDRYHVGALDSDDQPYDLPVFLSGAEGSNRVLVFIGGLYDGMGSVPYVKALDTLATEAGWVLAQPHLTSAHRGFGLSSLARDALELEFCVKHLKTLGASIFVLMGHSTGCQDLMTYILDGHEPMPISGAILQAPVSDREAFVGEKYDSLRAAAQRMFDNGDLLDTVHHELAREAFGFNHLTAYRAWSLLCKGGDDDFFSSDLPDSDVDSGPDTVHRSLDETFGQLPHGVSITYVFSGADEYTPASVDKRALFDRWRKAANGADLRFAVVEGASHAVKELEKQKELMEIVRGVLQEVEGKANADSNTEH